MEEIPLEKIDIENIEKKANSQENQSILLFKRLSNLNIKKQLIDLLLKGEEYSSNHSFTFSKDKDDKIILIKKYKTPKTREELEEIYDKRLQQIISSTDFDFSHESSTGGLGDIPEKIHIGFELPKGKLTDFQWSIFEAHEKGHTMRQFSYSSFFDKYFSVGFDFSKVNYTQDDYLFYLSVRKQETNNKEPETIDKAKKAIIEYLSSASEIAERMSQLKNYFGMDSDQIFTSEHLKYAREHYDKDTGLDFDMHLFFQAITPETEEKFLELLNNSGI
jgi:hypothetical protein